MGRSPCCDNPGIKKGPWTPEEDIVLFSYIQQHGPRNWRYVPINTGLMRCSKSCRLRWTNYLRPGIKRGSFSPQEEGIIVHLQALIGNRWAAIASYLPQRTDNDIKNYWNTHLKKKLQKFHDSFTHNNGDAFINSGDLNSPNDHPSYVDGPLIDIATSTSNPNIQGWIQSSSRPESCNDSSNITYNSNNVNFLNYVSPENFTWPEKPVAADGRSSSLNYLEKWLLEDTTGVQLDGLVELPSELLQI